MKRFGRIALLALPAALLLLCTFGYLLSPNDPNKVDLLAKFLPPGGIYPLGTDQMGRCVLSRILYGGRVTIGITLGGSFLVVALGMAIGLLIGQHRGGGTIADSILNAITAIPPIAYLIVFIGAWGNGIPTMLVALVTSNLMRVIKLVKTRAESEQQRAYALCAIASGASRPHLLFVHIAPNLIREVVHFVCLSCTDMVMAIVSFSFIGLGLGDNVIDWGMMVSEARGVLMLSPGLILYPVGAILLCTISFNLIAKALEGGDRDA